MIIAVSCGQARAMSVVSNGAGVWVHSAAPFEQSCSCSYFYRMNELGEAVFSTCVSCPANPKCGYPVAAAQEAAQRYFDMELVQAQSKHSASAMTRYSAEYDMWAGTHE